MRYRGTRTLNRGFLLVFAAATAVVAAVAFAGFPGSARAFNPDCIGVTDPEECVENPADGQLNPGDAGSVIEQDDGQGQNNVQPGLHDNGRGGNTFVNDPCLDPPPPDRARTVQSETELATFGTKYVVVGYNDSYGFYDNRQGLSGVAYSVDGGNKFVDQAGLPPIVRSGAPAFTPGSDHYAGDPVVVVDRSARTFTVNGQPTQQAPGQFYYASIYWTGEYFTISVNRGRFQTAPPETTESVSDTRCLNNPSLQGVVNPQTLPNERIVWEPPVQAVLPPFLGVGNEDFLDKEWLHVSQATGTLYLTYTRFTPAGETPIEMVRSYDGGRTWTPPSVIVPNLPDTFNQATQPVTVSSVNGRVVVTWYSRTFDLITGAEVSDRIEYAISNDDGQTFGPTQVVSTVNPQGEPPGYNRNRTQILNTPYITSRGSDVYIAYFSGRDGSPTVPGTVPGPRPSDIFVSPSHDGGTTFGPRVKVNDDDGQSSHVFPTVQVNKNGYVFVSWLDRRNDPANNLTDTWAAVSKDGGATYGHNVLQTDVATDWRVRADARPNFGDYNSSDLLGDNQFVTTWADGRFIAQGQTATPDTVFTIANGLGIGIG